MKDFFNFGIKNNKKTVIENIIKAMQDPKIKVMQGKNRITISKKELKSLPDIKGRQASGKLPVAKDPKMVELIEKGRKGDLTITQWLKKLIKIKK